MGRRAPKRVDGLRRGSTGSSIFSTPRHRPTGSARGLEASFTGRVSNPSIGESSEHASSVVDVTAGTHPRGGEGGGSEQRAGCDRGSRGAGRAAPPGGSARTWPRPTSAEVCASPPRPMVMLGDDSTARGVGDFQAARVRARSARARVARAGDPGVAIRGARRRSARGEREVRRVDARGGGEGRRRARRCERGERGARATRPGGRSGSIDPRASIRHAIKQGISSGVD